MKLLHLGLILLVGVLIIKAVDAYNKEGFDFAKADNDQKNYLKRDDKYWFSRLFPQVVKNGAEESKFVKLNRTKTKLENVAPGGSVDKTDTQKYIEKCRIINDTNDCDNIEPVSVTGPDGKIIPDLGCGYCYDTDKIIFGNKNGPFTDICTKKGWVPPGNDTAFFCKKKKEQELCKKMTDCGDSTGEKSICAWCPLTASGMPKKPGPKGGFVPKYDDDKCDWKSNMADELGKNAMKCTDLPTKKESQFGNEGTINANSTIEKRKWHDVDGKYYDCEKYGEGSNCRSWGNGYMYQNLTGNKACCVCGGGKKGIDFDGDLIQPADCKKFEQMFPCVGPKMMTGPHSTACLQSQWQKSGCSGTLQDRVKDREDYNTWNSGVYSWAGDNMKESIKKVALESSDYSKAEPAYKKCFGTDIDPCKPRFKPRPVPCSVKLYKNGGCTKEGELYPENRDSWPNAYANQTWANGQKSTWSNGEFTNKINQIKRDALRGQQVQSNTSIPLFDKVIDDNLKCFGKKPQLPFNKPCWRDFTLMMITMPGITISNGSISFNNTPSFKNLLVVKERGYWKNEYTWTGKYELIKETYKKEYFPFWNFTRIARDYWNRNWTLFKSKMLKVPSVQLPAPGSGDCKGDGLTFLSGSPFDNLTGQTTSKTDADNSGIFLMCGNDKFISQRAFQSTNFPYWYFIRVASVN